MGSSVDIRLAFGIPSLKREDLRDPKDEPWERCYDDANQPWMYLDFGSDYSNDATSIAIRESITSTEVWDCIPIKTSLPKNQEWMSILSNVCKSKGIPFEPDKCCWFVSGYWYE